jgi:hypothetical protein
VAGSAIEPDLTLAWSLILRSHAEFRLMKGPEASLTTPAVDVDISGALACRVRRISRLSSHLVCFNRSILEGGGGHLQGRGLRHAAVTRDRPPLESRALV